MLVCADQVLHQNHVRHSTFPIKNMAATFARFTQLLTIEFLYQRRSMGPCVYIFYLTKRVCSALFNPMSTWISKYSIFRFSCFRSMEFITRRMHCNEYAYIYTRSTASLNNRSVYFIYLYYILYNLFNVTLYMYTPMYTIYA